MGTMAWLCLCIFSTEALICIKFGIDMFPNPAPPEVFWPWLLVLVVGGISLTVYFVRKEMSPKAGEAGGKQYKRKRPRRSKSKKGSDSDTSKDTNGDNELEEPVVRKKKNN